MRITFVTRTFGNVERNSHCDVLHITPIRVARLFLDCNGDFAIKAYWPDSQQRTSSRVIHGSGSANYIKIGDGRLFMQWPHAIVGAEPVIFNRECRLRMLRDNSLTTLVPGIYNKY